MDKLMVYDFNNGDISITASVCDLYPILIKLGLISESDCADREAICWIRYWPNGYVFKSLAQLEYALLNELNKLRISFFTSKPLTSIRGIAPLVRAGHIPSLKTSDKPPSATVYTLWFHDERPRLAVSGINENYTSICGLFDDINTNYTRYCRHLGDDSSDEIKATVKHTNIRKSCGSSNSI